MWPRGVAHENGRERGYKQGLVDGRAGRWASGWPKSSMCDFGSLQSLIKMGFCDKIDKSTIVTAFK